jgi:predicted transcriptional regulator of viral defense system
MRRRSSPPPHTKPPQEQLVLQLAGQRPVVRAREVAELGIPTITLSRLVERGKLARVARGLYALPERSPSENRSLIEVVLRVPQGVICLLSALRAHGIGTQSASEVWVALPYGAALPRLDRPRLRIVKMSGMAMHAGVQRIVAEGVRIPVFGVEKTIADCFKFRHKIGLDVALEALREARRERKVAMDELWHYAAIDRVTKVMQPYLEGMAG